MRKPRILELRCATVAVVTLFIVFCCGWSGVATAQPLDDGAASFGERVEVELVNVEVWVTDAQGNAITGLEASDFEVFEDGEPVEISFFSEVRSPASFPELAPPVTIEAPVEAPPAKETLSVSDLLEDDAADAAPGFLVLYFDELFSNPASRGQLIDDLRGFLELRRVPPERVLILRQDQGLRVEANLGSTAGELYAALERLETASPRGAQTWADERNAIRRLQDDWERVAVLGNTAPGQDPCDYFVPEAFREAQFHVAASRARITETLDHLTHTASFLAGLPGPKTLIYVSDGLTVTPGVNLLNFVKHVCPGRQGERHLDLHDGLSEPFRRLTRHASANQVTMYTVQALGLQTQTSLTTADQRGVRNIYVGMGQYESETRAQQRQGLTMLALETGGRAIFNKNRFTEVFEQIGEEMTGYYSLAYEPLHDGDGLEHRIEVRLKDGKGRGAKLRHRPGYRDKGRDQRMAERLESALYLNLMANPLEVRLGAGQLKGAEKNTYTVPFHVVVPVEKITFLPQRKGDMARLTVLVMAQDERHRQTALKREVYELARPKGGADPSISLVVTLDLSAAIHIVAFAVRDEASQEISFVATGLDLRSPQAAAGR